MSVHTDNIFKSMKDVRFEQTREVDAWQAQVAHLALLPRASLTLDIPAPSRPGTWRRSPAVTAETASAASAPGSMRSVQE